MVIKPKVRGFVCITAHPAGCAAHVQEQIDYVKAQPPLKNGPKKVLVIGASTGYGLASRISAAFGSGAATIGVFFERPSDDDKTGSAGWYNTAAFTTAAKAAGLYARNFNGDAFSDALKADVLAAIKADLGQVDLIVYSLASPRRTHPKTGVVHKSVLKPVGQSYTNKTVDTDKGIVSQITIDPASETEITDTAAVMGGEDWEMWINALSDAGLIAPGATSVAYSYIGPKSRGPSTKTAPSASPRTTRTRRQIHQRHAQDPRLRTRLHLGQQSARHPGQLRHPGRAALYFDPLQGHEGEGHARRLHRANPTSFRRTNVWRRRTRI